jgi:hypothetical protein
MVLLYAGILLFSYQDIIFQTELTHYTGQSAIEHNLVHPPAWRTLGLLVTCALSLVLYVYGYIFIKREPGISVRHLFWTSVFISLIFLFTMPFDSTDISVYINLGWLQSHYHLNPFIYSVSDIAHWQNDPMLRDHWTGFPCVYGPLYALLAKLLSQAGGGHFLLTVLLFKLPNMLCHLGITALLLTLDTNGSNTRAPVERAYLYAMNPYILLQHVANVHNDLLMAFFTCLSVYLLMKRRWLWVLPALMAGILLKYISAIILPIMLYVLARQAGWRTALKSLGVALLLASLLIPLYFTEPHRIRFDLILQNTDAYVGSIQAFVMYSVLPAIETLIKPLGSYRLVVAYILKYSLWAALLAFYIRGIYKIRGVQSGYTQKALETMVALHLFVIFLVSTKFYPWYLGMVFPLALFLPENSMYRELAMILSCLLTFFLILLGFPDDLLPLQIFLMTGPLTYSRAFTRLVGTNPGKPAPTPSVD